MEKYSRWRDAGTGIHPFLPPKRLRTNATPFKILASAVKNYLIGPPVAALKLLLVAIIGLLFFFFDLLTRHPSPPTTMEINSLVNIVSKFIVTDGILVDPGFEGVITEGSPETTYCKNKQWRTERGHHRVESCLVRRDPVFGLQPTFTHVSSTGLVQRLSLWQALKSVGDVGEFESSKDHVPLVKLAQEAREKGWGPVVVFPEGTTSNGRGLLKVLPVFDTWTNDKASPKIHIIGFKYDYDEFAPSVTVGNTFSHLFWMLAQFANFVEVKYLPSDEVTLTPGEESFTSQISGLSGQVLRVRKTSLGVQDKVDFLDYYRAREIKAAGTPRKSR
ncbi:hypothetical protein HK097_010232 [Rhizophlyctis rosea]|uniref:Phospholipid/glycerol acyltransferase domain-containing protein n=1 Tax=Rhizophlyctis rosea TaxID=64517 RepID=A0AAD5S9H9_9FUNG|nr:hypothetical protein HK097_010232 [Rhizophlyctis rosea]